MKTILIKIIVLTLLFSINIFAQNGGKAEPRRVKFAKGKSSTVLTGMLTNDQQMEYVFGARAGQKISLKVTSIPKGKFFDFDLMGDGFELETDRDYYEDYTFTAPETGDYLVFVRKRPTEKVMTAKFSLTLAIR